MTCLEVQDEYRFYRQVLLDDLSEEQYNNPRPELVEQAKERREEFWVRMKALGFSDQTVPLYTQKPDGDHVRGFRAFSTRTAYGLADLQTLIPALTADAFVETPVAALVISKEVDPRAKEAWEAFSASRLALEGRGLWVLKSPPFGDNYAEAPTISEALGSIDKHPLVTPYSMHALVSKLEKAQYRANALTAYYPDLNSALKAGLGLEDVQPMDAEFVMPVAVERGGRILALKDVRYCPELIACGMGIFPSYGAAFGKDGEKSELVVDALREVNRVSARAVSALDVITRNVTESFDVDEVNEALEGLMREDQALDRGFECISGTPLSLPEDAPGQPGAVQAHLLTPATVRSWSRRLAAFAAAGGVDGADAEKLGGLLSAVVDSSRREMSLRARTQAKAALDSMTRTVAVDPAAGTGQVKHVDAGEKIGGARKDFARRYMTVEDLETMNDVEKRSLVVKKNVWPPLNYAEMRDAGVTPQAAMAIKTIKDMLNTEAIEDQRTRGDLHDDAVTYIKAVSLVRDALADAKTVDDVVLGMKHVGTVGRTVGQEVTNYVYGTPLQVQWGQKASNLFYEASHYNYLPSTLSRVISRKVKPDAEWGHLIKESVEKTDEEKEAESEKVQVDRHLHRPHLEKVIRDGGNDWRNGRDVTADDLIEHFGFRAVEFGNWLPQDERQTVLNFAFDSFCDLSDALSLPPRAASFDGDLAIAFGSRGSGGKRAALAHYEPMRRVINLTRMAGAGALAHEWWHGFATWHQGSATARLKHGQRPIYTGDPLPKVIDTMMVRPRTPDELAYRSKDEAANAFGHALGWARYKQGAHVYLHMKEHFDQQSAALEANLLARARERLTTLGTKDCRSLPHGIDPRYGVIDAAYCWEIGDEIAAGAGSFADNDRAFRGHRKNVEGNARAAVRSMAVAMTIQAGLELGVTFDERFLGADNAVPTAFLLNAKKLDELRSKPYWATEDELFARAGAQFVLYELTDRGVRNDYLVFGADEGRYADYAHGNPNPFGDDRLRLKAQFDALVDDFRLRLAKSLEAQSQCEP
jgi:Large polyvalent protein-associated domain 1